MVAMTATAGTSSATPGVGAAGDVAVVVEAVLGLEGGGMIRVDGQQVEVIVGGQLGHGGGGVARYHKGRVDGAVAQGVGGVGEALVGHVDVVKGQAVGFQDLLGVELAAAAGVAHRDVLPSQLVDGGYIGRGNDLYVFRIEGADGGKAGDGILSGEQIGAGVSVVHNVVLHQSQVAFPGHPASGC